MGALQVKNTSTLLLVFFIMMINSRSTIARYPDPPVFAAVQHYPSICYLPPDSGLCPESSSESESSSDLLVRYYFDTTTEQCYAFGVQNCGGNENRFETRHFCQNFCRITEKS